MKKIKYQGAITKILAEKKAAYYKRAFLKNIDDILKQLLNQNKVAFDVISYSGVDSFEDQLLSVYSFMSNVGIPASWTVYSDKSYNTNHKNIFRKYFPFLSIQDWDVFDYIDNNDCLKEYLSTCHLAKKVNVILGYPCSRQTIYADSDVIFYKRIAYYINSQVFNKGLWYAPDVIKNIGLPGKDQQEYSLNSGFLIFNKEFNRDNVLFYFQNLKGNFQYFSEQSSFDFAFKKQRANVLDPRLFVVSTDDQFDFSYKYLPANIAMRHYVSPVRHKIWQKGWQWHLK